MRRHRLSSKRRARWKEACKSRKAVLMWPYTYPPNGCSAGACCSAGQQRPCSHTFAHAVAQPAQPSRHDRGQSAHLRRGRISRAPQRQPVRGIAGLNGTTSRPRAAEERQGLGEPLAEARRRRAKCEGGPPSRRSGGLLSSRRYGGTAFADENDSLACLAVRLRVHLACLAEARRRRAKAGAEEGIRTPTPLRAPAPQAGASASSATSARRAARPN